MKYFYIAVLFITGAICIYTGVTLLDLFGQYGDTSIDNAFRDYYIGVFLFSALAFCVSFVGVKKSI